MATTALILLLGASGCQMGRISSDEVVQFFPTPGHMDPANGQWILPIRGWVYEPERDSLRRKWLEKALIDALDIEDDRAQTAIFKDRIRAFLVDNERDISVDVLIGPYTFHAGTTEKSGHFLGQLVLSKLQVDYLLNQQQRGRQYLIYRAKLPSRDNRIFQGVVRLIPREGISIISDIDDTIKITQVNDKSELLENTFLEPFEEVPGMSSVYRAWAKQGAEFHYVSGSPWQLYEPLSTFMRGEGFPEGTFHLKMMRLKNIRSDLSSSRLKFKLDVISQLFEQFPNRRFILVGDSGEHDPEVYAEIAQRYPRQVEFIWIRDLKQLGRDHEQFRHTFRKIPRDIWNVFTDARQIDSSLH